jgi:hypothetical protein
MDRDNGTSLVILGLLLLHGLTDVVIAVYGTRDFDPAVMDLLGGALSRCQVCLLAIWLVAGRERFSWRICGLLAGTGLAFVVFSRPEFSGQMEIGSESIWLEEEWAYYFRPAGPGDLLVALPVLVGGVATSLLLFRVEKGSRRHGERRADLARPARRLRFSFHDVAVWTGTICVLLVSLFQTAPYPGWISELGDQWHSFFYRLHQPGATFRIGSAMLYVIVALASLWLIHGKSRLRVRGPVFCAAILAAAVAFREWRRAVGMSSDYDDVSEISSSVIAAITTIATLWLVKLYDSQSEDD